MLAHQLFIKINKCKSLCKAFLMASLIAFGSQSYVVHGSSEEVFSYLQNIQIHLFFSNNCLEIIDLFSLYVLK